MLETRNWITLFFPFTTIITVAAGNPGLRITGGDLAQTNAGSVVVAESGSTTTGFETLISQNNFKSDHTAQPTLSIDATLPMRMGILSLLPLKK